MTWPTLISEVDFEGYPTATFHDTLFYDDDVLSYWRCSDATAYVFGTSSIGSTVNNLNADKKNVLKFTASRSTDITDIYVYLDGFGGGGASQVLKAVMYSDSAGSPSSLLGTSVEVTVLAGQAEGWVRFRLSSPVGVTSGTSYWIGLIAGGTSAVARFFAETTGGTRKNNSDTYSDGPANPFGAVTLSDSFSWSIYAAETILADEKELNDGTLSGAPSFVSSLLPLDTDEALSFDGSNDFASVPSSASLLQAGSWAIEGLVSPGSIPGSTATLVTQGAWSVELRSDATLQFTVKNEVGGTVTTTTVTGTTPLEVGSTYLVRCVHDAELDELRLYVNGRVEGTASHSAGTELWGLPLLFAANHGSTSPAFGSVGSTLATSSATWAIPAPASIAVGDLLVAQMQHTQPGITITTPPSGWQSWAGVDHSSQYGSKVYYKIADAGDVGVATFTFIWSAGVGTGQGVISRFTGVDTSQPFANPSYYADTASAAAHSTGNHLPNVLDVLMVAMVGKRDNGTTTGSDAGGATLTERYDTASAGGSGASGMAMYTAALSDRSTTRNVTMTSTSAAFAAAFLMFLKGPDAQGYADVDLDDWTWSSVAGDDDTAMDHYAAMDSGEGTRTDITNDSKVADISRGRQYDLDRFEAGTCRETLRDHDRNYDPSNTSGLYFPHVETKRRHWLRAAVGASTFDLFSGYVERWPQAWLAPEYQETNITAADGMAALALAPVSGTLDSDLSGAQIHRLLDLARWPRELRAIDDGQFVMDVWELGANAKALSSIQEIEGSELGAFFMSAAGVATFHDYAHRWTDARSLNVQVTFSDDASDIAGGALPYIFGGIAPSWDDDTTVNEWTVATAAGVEVTVKDVVGARKAFGLAQSRTTRLVSHGDAETQALALLQRTARAGQRFDTLEVVPTTEAGWQAVLGLEISDRVKVVRTPGTGSQLVQECFVEAIAIEAPPEDWRVTLSLSPVSPASFYDTVVRSGPRSYYRMDETS